MQEFYPFFLIIFAGVFFSVVFRRIHVPWVVALILGGILIGPYMLDLVEVTPTVEFIGQIGVIFLMFMAGLEAKPATFKNLSGRFLWLPFINGAIPFLIGLSIGFFFGYGWVSSLLIGIIFVSSSIAVIIPSLERNNMLSTRLGQSVIMTSIIQDVASLVLLSIVLQTINPTTKLSLYIFYPLLLAILVLFRLLLPKIRKLFIFSVSETRDFFQQEFRATFLILIGTVIAFEIMGLHPIIAGFFAGFVLAGSVTSPELKDKIRVISYGIFIPTFFIIIGIKTDVSFFSEANGILLLIAVVVFGSMSSKFLSGWVGGVLAGFSSKQSWLFGASSMPQLSTTLATAFTAHALGFIDEKLITAMVVLSVVTTIVGPALMALILKSFSRSESNLDFGSASESSSPQPQVLVSNN